MSLSQRIGKFVEIYEVFIDILDRLDTYLADILIHAHANLHRISASFWWSVKKSQSDVAVSALSLANKVDL